MLMRTRTIAFTVTFTARYCTQTRALTQLHNPYFLRSSPPHHVQTNTHNHHSSTYPAHTHARRVHTENTAASAQYVQVHRRGLGEALEHAVDLLDVQPHVGLPLPAAQHQVVHFFRTGAGPLQHTALGDALNHL